MPSLTFPACCVPEFVQCAAVLPLKIPVNGNNNRMDFVSFDFILSIFDLHSDYYELIYTDWNSDCLTQNRNGSIL